MGHVSRPYLIIRKIGLLKNLLQHLQFPIRNLQELVVDDASEEPTSPHNGAPSPRENGLDKLQPKKEHPPHSPRFVYLS